MDRRAQPTADSHAPIYPFATARWWSGYFGHMQVSWQTNPNGSGGTIRYAVSDDWVNDYLCRVFGRCNWPRPVVPVDDLNITYPLNNVEASVALDGSGVLVTLKNNMFEFGAYEAKIDDGDWQSMIPLNPQSEQGV